MTRAELLAQGADLERRLGSPQDHASVTGFRAALSADEHERFPDDAWDALVGLGYFELFVPPDLGGRFSQLSELLLMGRLVARRDLALAIAAGQCLLGALPVWIAGSPALRERQAALLLGGQAGALALTEEAHGSDLAGGEVQALSSAPGAFTLTGAKWCINNATRGHSLTVLARTDPAGGPRGFSLLFLDKQALGEAGQLTRYVPLPKLRTQGIRAADISGARFDQLEVPHAALVGKPGRGLDVVLRTLQVSRTLCAAFSLGAADSALRAALDFVSTRRLYGDDLLALPAVQRLIARAALHLHQADALAVLACRVAGEAPEQLSVLSAVVKLAVPALCQRVIDDSVTLLGARHYLREEPFAHVQKLCRDAALVTLFDGSAEVNRHVLAGQLGALVAARGSEVELRGGEAEALLRRASALDEPAAVLDLGELRTSARGRDDVLNALFALPPEHPIAVARVRFDARVMHAQAAGHAPRDVAFFELADDYVRLVTAAALEHIRRARPTTGLLSELSDAAHQQFLVSALAPESFRASDAPELMAQAVAHALREHAAQRLFGALPVELAQ
ncbi:MAG: acyl-CoA dehydrogenase family protein [Sandaracinaceae bacterium]|nr:acyl-CoA dehydrogenase family protein [Sandaracinaceae bacterium]